MTSPIGEDEIGIPVGIVMSTGRIDVIPMTGAGTRETAGIPVTEIITPGRRTKTATREATVDDRPIEILKAEGVEIRTIVMEAKKALKAQKVSEIITKTTGSSFQV